MGLSKTKNAELDKKKNNKDDPIEYPATENTFIFLMLKAITVIKARMPYPTNCPQPQKPGAILNTSNKTSERNIANKGSAKANLLFLITAPAKMAMPIIGLKL